MSDFLCCYLVIAFCATPPSLVQSSVLYDRAAVGPESSRWASRATAGLIFPLICSTLVLYSMTLQCFNLQRSLFLSVSLFSIFCLYHLVSPRCRRTEKHTGLTMQQWVQSLCPGQPVCSCSAVFYSTGLHKQTAHEQLLSKWSPGCVLSHIQAQTHIYFCTQMLHLSQNAHVLYTQKQKVSSLFLP